MCDPLGTVGDLAVYDAGNPNDPNDDATTVVSHVVYDGFGRKVSETAAVDHLFAFTGRLLDEATGLQNNLNRWYDPSVGRWLSADPIGFAAGDVNLYRYVGNAPTNRVDPSGEAWWNLWLCDLSAALGERFGTALTNYRYADADLKRNARLRELHIKYPDIYGQRGVNPVHSSVRGCSFAIGAATDIAETGVYLQSASAGMATPQGSCRLPATSSSRPTPSPPPSTRPPAQRAAPTGVSAEEGGLNLFKWGQPQTKAGGWQTGDRMLYLRDQGTPKLNWQQNAGRLRSEMRQGKPIFDTHIDPATGQQIPTGGFLRAERYLLESRGWRFDPQTGAYHPPGG